MSVPLTFKILKFCQYFLLILLFLSNTQCASKKKPKNSNGHTITLKIPFEEVWRATQQTMLSYPMNMNNIDTGTLETLYLSGKQRFRAAHATKPLKESYQYRIRIQLLSSKRRKKTKITVLKEARNKTDFFSEPKEAESDGFEEKAILYRIRRELSIDKKLKRIHKKNKNA